MFNLSQQIWSVASELCYIYMSTFTSIYCDFRFVLISVQQNDFCSLTIKSIKSLYRRNGITITGTINDTNLYFLQKGRNQSAEETVPNAFQLWHNSSLLILDLIEFLQELKMLYFKTIKKGILPMPQNVHIAMPFYLLRRAQYHWSSHPGVSKGKAIERWFR